MIYRVVRLSTGKYRLQFRILLFFWFDSSAGDFDTLEAAENYWKPAPSIPPEVLEKYPSFKVEL